MLIFAPNLEEVEEVGGGCVDGDEVLVWLGGRVWEGADSEVAGAGHVGFYLNGAHHERKLSRQIMCLNWRTKITSYRYHAIRHNPFLSMNSLESA